MPRYLVVRRFDVSEDEMPEVGRRSRRTIENGYPEITWEHSHVLVGDDGVVMTYCIYDAPNEELVRAHGSDLGDHTIEDVREITADVTPADFPS